MPQENTHFEIEYIGITEAAEYLRVSASTLRRWEKKGFLVPERTPTGIRRYTKQQLDDVIQSPNGFQSTSDKLEPYEQLQASVQNQIEEMAAESSETISNDLQKVPPIEESMPEESPKVGSSDNFNLIHTYPSYQSVDSHLDAILDSKNIESLVMPRIEEPENKSIEVKDLIYSYNANSLNPNIKSDDESGLIKDQPQLKLEPVLPLKAVEQFHHEFDESEEMPVQDLDEYDSDAASDVLNLRVGQNTADGEVGLDSKAKTKSKLPTKFIWGGIAGLVLIIVGVSLWVVLSMNSSSELISPLAQ